MDAVESGRAKNEAAVWVNLIATSCMVLQHRSFLMDYPSSTTAFSSATSLRTLISFIKAS